MKVASYLYKNNQLEKSRDENQISPETCHLVLGFGAKQYLSEGSVYKRLREKFPKAEIALCSTAGEIFCTEVLDDTLSVVAIAFEKATVTSAKVNSADFKSSFEAGAGLINQLDQRDLKYVFVLSDGALVNGSELVRGMDSIVKNKIPITGGLAGDGTHFNSTLVGLNSEAKEGTILAIGFYGDTIKISHGSMGGWDNFGLEKTVTASSSNTLFEIDEKNALEVYKTYLGKYAAELPGSALMFPLSVKLPQSEEAIVRTILSIDMERKSMTFAGDVPVGSKVRFMKANFDRLIDAASLAAGQTLTFSNNTQPKLALLISCVGRKIILGKRVDEEVEAVTEALKNKPIITGFYSYGEISPLNPHGRCELHNQTMTITTFDEI